MARLVSGPVHVVLDSPVGPLTVVAEDEAVIGIYFAGHRRRHPLPPAGLALPAEPVLQDTAGQLAEYFAGRRRAFDLPLAPRGDAFQQDVWALLQDIPYGKTRSYGDLAAALGRPGAARAVGAANGANPISIVIPCHRVVGADGTLTGYAGGLDRKRFLLDLERPPPGDDGRLF
ncbi:MAG: methylated-DNA--[protein]-cysteine S-methyltransferase [Tetrasphaera sp.]